MTETQHKQDAPPLDPSPPKEHPIVPRPRTGDPIVYTDYSGKQRLAHVTAWHEGRTGRCTLVAFGTERGDEAATLYYDVTFNAVPASNTWRPA